MRVYVASKTDMAPLWRALRAAWAQLRTHGVGTIVVSRWIDVDPALPPDGHRQLWAEIIADMERADVLLVRAREGDVFKGVLVEIGMAFAWGLPIVVVGDCASLRAGDGSDASFMAARGVHRLPADATPAEWHHALRRALEADTDEHLARGDGA